MYYGICRLTVRRCWQVWGRASTVDAARTLSCSGACGSGPNSQRKYLQRHTWHPRWTGLHDSLRVSRSPWQPTWTGLPASCRGFHASAFLAKDETKLESSVKILKEETEKQEPPKASVANVAAKETVPAKPKPSIKERVIAELKHYYHGFRLLFIDVKISSRYAWDLLNGKNLSRRERRQLVRTTADLFRLVPFLVFIIVPFMEFLLPIALKLFPNMLPSTFQEEDREKEKRKKKLKVKLELAKFLQDTIHESAIERRDRQAAHSELATEFARFIEQIRSSGSHVKTEDIVRFSKLFKDDMTLDSMSRAQLSALCNLLELPTIGPNSILLFQLRYQLRKLKADDKMIQKEGLESLTLNELQAASRARGMRALGVPEWRLRHQLQQWLDLHLNERVPTSLLLLSRALYLPDNLSKEDQLKEAISALSESTAAQEAKLHAAELTGDKIDNEAKLTLIRLEEERIKKEREAEAATAAAAAQVATATAVPAAPITVPEAKATTSNVSVAAQPQQQRQQVPLNEAVFHGDNSADSLVDKAAEIRDMADDLADKGISVKEIREEAIISSADLDQLESVLEKIAAEKNISLEHSELLELKEEVIEYQEDLQDLKSLVTASRGQSLTVRESKAAIRLSKAVSRLMSNMNHVINDLHKDKAALMEDIEVKEVKIRRNESLKADDAQRQQIMDQISETKDTVISINELVLAMKRLQKLPDDTRLQKIAEVLDEDRDGHIDVSHVLRVLHELGTENVKVTGNQMTSIIDLLKKEAVLEEEEKVEKQQKNAEHADSRAEAKVSQQNK